MVNFHHVIFSRISDAFLCSAGTAAVHFPLGRLDMTETASMLEVLFGSNEI